MKIIIQILTLSIVSFGLVGCADGGDSQTGDSSLALSAALDDCLAEIGECRANAADEAEYVENCRALMACLPERDLEQTSDRTWRTYCQGVDARCEGGDVDEETCVELRRRCAGAGDRGDDESSACYWDCVEDGGDKETCRLDCQGDGGQSAEPVSAEECMDGCTADGIDAALCSERCGLL
ncbi:MAG: hypothetical protein QF464_12995 [Myxococcota bacterium]|jgi:hypothetical protein|nr:hypothetical protein [Myxococcota bacterium]